MKMSRRILSLVLAAALLITCGITGLVLPVSAASGENLIINGDFEQGTGVGIANSYTAEGVGKDGSWGSERVVTSSGDGGTTTLKLLVTKSGHVTEKMQQSTVYMLKFDYKNVGGKTQVYFNSNYGTGVASSLPGIKMGTSLSSTGVTLSAGDTDGWQNCYIVFESRESISSNPQDNGIILRRGTSTGTLSIDNVELFKVDLSAPSVTNGTINLSTAESSTPAAWVLDASEGTDVTVQVTPDEGYMMVPGSLKYTTASGTEVKILNKASGGFGEGVGNEFAFEMPAEPVEVTAEFVEAAEGDYLMDSIGASVHYTAGQADGIRFLTRLNVAGEFDATADALMLGGQEVAEIGTLLKRGEVQTLTLEDMATAPATGEGKMWKAVNYSAEAGIYKVDDYTGSYLDFATVMMTTVTDRTFTAVGYITFADGTTVYSSNVKSDSIASAEARM